MLALALMLAAFARADIGEHAKLSGIVEVPKLFGDSGSPAQTPVKPGAVKIYPQPAKKKWPPAKRIDAPGDIASEEFAGERSGAVVFRTRRGFYEVKIKDGKGWLAAEEAGKFHALEDLVAGGLAYMTPDFDGALFETPAKDAPVKRLEAGEDERGAQVLAHKKNKDGLWLQVRVLDGSPCGGGEPKELGTGWVRAWAENGIANVWFHARGC